MLPVQPQIDFRPGEANQLYIKLGFAAGNGLTEKSPFNLATWAADAKDSEGNISGRKLSHLLTAWYKHTFQITREQDLGFSIGIIDGTDYLDNNAYANDEYTQFMNAALTNGPNVFVPSYELGTALEWKNGRWSLNGVLMNIRESDASENVIFYGLQTGYSVNNSFGAGNYRIILTGTNRKNPNSKNTQLARRAAMLISLDQQFGKIIGGWTRIGWQDKQAAVDYSFIYSGGIDIKGTRWGRAHDNIGLGFVHLAGGNLDLTKSQVIEAYYRWQLGEMFGVTADVQFLSDKTKTGQNPEGIVYSLRAVAEF